MLQDLCGNNGYKIDVGNYEAANMYNYKIFNSTIYIRLINIIWSVECHKRSLSTST